MHEKSIIDIIKMKGSLQDAIRRLMFWAFTCIQYSRSLRTLDNLSEIIKAIQETEPIMSCIEKIIWHWLENNKKLHDGKMWQVDVACDRRKLLAYSTFLDVLDEVVVSYIKHPLAAIVFKVETCNAWNSCSWQVNDQPCYQKMNVWMHHLANEDVVDISKEPPPSGPECFYGPNILLDLKHPFSKVFLHQIEEKVQKQCTKECSLIMTEKGTDFVPKQELNAIFVKYLDPIKQSASAMFQHKYDNQKDDYFDDFCALLCSRRTVVLDITKKVDMLKNILTSLISLSDESFPMFVTKLHVTWWLNEPKLHAVQHLVDACMQVQFGEPDGYYHEFTRLIGSNERLDGSTEEQESNLDESEEQLPSETSETDEDESCFEITTWSRITEHVCQRLLQSSTELKDKDNCNTWQRNTSMVLTHADDVSVLPHVSHSLSLCNHFSTMIVVFGGISEQYVVQLGEQLTKNTLNSKEMFDFILRFLKELNSEAGVPFEHVLQFYSCYVCCCMAASPDTPIMEWVLDETVSIELLKEGDFYLFGPALHLATASNLGLDHGPINLFDIITDQRTIQHPTFFQKLDEILKGQLGESSFPCVCVDMFQHFIVDNEIKEETFISCWNKYISSNMSLAHIIAVAYIKYHLERFSKLESQNILIEKFSKEEQNEKKLYGLQRHFIECAVAGNGIITLNHLCKRYRFLEDKNQQLLISTFDLNPLKPFQLDQENTIKDAFKTFPNDEKSLTMIISASENGGSVQLALFSFALENFFLSRLMHPLSEKSKRNSSCICRAAEASKMSKSALKLLRCLCCQEDFNSSLVVNLSEETREKEFQITSFLIHVMCCCLVNHQDHKPLIWCICMLNTSDVAKFYLSAVTKTDDTKQGFFPSLTDVKEVQFSECDCNFRSATLDNGSDGDMCTVCSQRIKSDKMAQKHLSLMQEDKPMYKGYIPCEPSNDMMTTARSLSPVAFRFFHLLMHACFAGSLALGVLEEQELAEHLNLEKDVDVQDFLKKHITTHWEVLRQLTACGNAQLGKFLHMLLHEMEFLLFHEQTLFETAKNRQFYEDSICKKIDEITERRFSAFQDVTRKCTDEPESFDSILYEVNLDEGRCPLFLRHTLPPSVENMKSEFMINKMDKKYPFLALVFAKEKQLALLGCLLPLVKWNLFCFEKISYKWTRNELKQTFLSEFIDRDDQKEHFHELFKNFRDSWNKLLSNEKLLKKYNKNLGRIPQLVMTNIVEDCIIINSSSTIYQILIALKNIQNEFLEDASIISLTLESPSLSFVKKTDKSAYLSVLPIEEVTDKEIVHLNMDLSKQRLNETFLKFSQCCTGYGHGRIHNYDFYFIERQFADHILVKKPCLEVTTSFPVIVFLGDCLYRSVTPFEDIEAFVEQHEITTDIKKKVLNLKCQSHTYLRIILEYLEIIFTLMKKSELPKNKTDYHAQYYITQWPIYFLQKSPHVEGLLNPIKLCFLTSLFEYVESLEADTAIGFLGDKFTTPLNEELEINLRSLTEKNTLDLLERLLAALKRFAYQYINVPDVFAGDQLGPKILQNAVLWPRDTQRLFPEGPTQLDIHPNLCVEHIKSTVQFLHRYIEKKKGRFEPEGEVIKPKKTALLLG
ncbi:uncharacterized protein LOC121378222 [Gigantopelta aegis]|uniref:uncharacterized protein LOC121378222 n=1 Tax=Gigantopelta aegis TaxID=1735272 RepID=UPI001B88CA66|nr:uncharacterized protein LOC121378222 [Gigantopelta aegis]XP_041362234.1 uncharacterized protein LOC121378222 [Gigantopelta aegis]